MRPRIKPHTNTTTDNAMLQSVLADIQTAEQFVLMLAVLHRYGVSKPANLLPAQVRPFTAELKAVLAGKAPDPRDSVLDPSMMEIR